MRPHEKPDVWRKSIDFVVALYEATEKFPRDEKFGLTSQLRRAAVSISANIAEGAARKTAKEFGYFLSNSQGSASEVETELLIAHRLHYLSDSTFRSLVSALDEIGRMLTGLAQYVREATNLFTIYDSRFTR